MFYNENLYYLWVGMVRNGHGLPGHGTLKLTVSQEWIDGMNWFFACWWKFRKAKSHFSGSSVGMVKNGHGHSANEILESALCNKNEFMNLADFLDPDWCNNFWLYQHYTLHLWLLNASLLQLYLLDPQGKPEWSYEIGSVHPSIVLSVWVFSWNWVIMFFWILAWC